MDDASAHILVSGRVQGVGFRDFALRSARRLELRGRVRNRADGRVEIDAEGSRPGLELYAGELRQGPRGARVEEVAVTWGPATGRWADFEVDF